MQELSGVCPRVSDPTSPQAQELATLLRLLSPVAPQPNGPNLSWAVPTIIKHGLFQFSHFLKHISSDHHQTDEFAFIIYPKNKIVFLKNIQTDNEQSNISL